MIDSVLKGTGNSRFLKSAVPAGTSWADALAMLQAGTFPIDFNGINTEGFQQVGTPLNKANLLKDATAAQIGLPPSTTPDGMFQALGNTGELHVWRKTVKNAEDIPAGYTLGDVQTGNFKFVADSYRTFEFGTPSVDDAGNVGLNVEGSVNGRYNSNFDNLKGKFCRPPDSTWYIDASLGSQVIYIPADATFSQSGSYKYVDKYQPVTGYPLTPAGTTTTYPVSINPNAYQEGSDAKEAGYTLGEVENNVQILSGGDNWPTTLYYADSVDVANEGQLSLQSPNQYTFTTSSQYQNVSTLAVGRFIKIVPEASSGFSFMDGIWFVPSDATVTVSNYKIYASKIQKVTGYAAIPAGTTIEYLGKLGDKARVQVVSYVGTGTYGSSNPNSLTFDFVPKVVMFLVGYYVSNNSVLCYLDSEYYRDSRVVVMSVVKADKYTPVGFGLSSQAWAKKTPDGKTLFWYNDYNQEDQANISGVRYYFLALG